MKFLNTLRAKVSDSEYVQAAPYLFGLRVLRLIPMPISRKIFCGIADYLARKPSVTFALRDNLAHVLQVSPAQVPTALIQNSLRSYLRYWLEAFKLPVMNKTSISENTELIGLEHVESYFSNPHQGVVLVLPHSGNWDAAGVWLVHQYRSFYTVNERVKPQVLYNKFVNYRESLGFHVLAHDEHPYPVLVEQLRAGSIVCLLVDRLVGINHKTSDKDDDQENKDNNLEKIIKNPKTSKVQVQFCDKYVSVTSGPVRLAQEAHVPLFAVYPSFTEHGWKLVISPPVEVSENFQQTMQEVMSFFQENINKKPEDWHAMQRIWREDEESLPPMNVQEGLSYSLQHHTENNQQVSHNYTHEHTIGTVNSMVEGTNVISSITPQWYGSACNSYGINDCNKDGLKEG